MRTSQAGLKAIEQREALRTRAYRDSAGVATIGYGHTQGVKMGQTITQEQAEEFLRKDIASAEAAVNKSLKQDVTQNQFDALVSLAFNIGNGNNRFTKSTVIRKLNAGDVEGAAAAFRLWNRAGGRVIRGLVNRRESEIKQFLS